MTHLSSLNGYLLHIILAKKCCNKETKRPAEQRKYAAHVCGLTADEGCPLKAIVMNEVKN